MANIELTLATELNTLTQALVSGQVRPEGIDLRCSTRERGPALFQRQLRTREYDVSEMSLTSVFMMADRGDDSLVALPVFASRGFFHTTALVRTDAGVDEPGKLLGKRIGIPQYQSAAALWCRAALRHEFGVLETGVSWFSQLSVDPSSGEIAFEPPTDLRLAVLQLGETLSKLLLAGDLDAIVNPVGSAPALLAEGSGVRQLFSDPRAEGARYYQKTGLYPFNHCIVVRRDVVDRYPWVMLNLYSAFLESSLRGTTASADALAPYLDTGLVGSDVASALRTNLFGYGVASEHLVLEAFAQYCFEQGYTSTTLDPRDVFAPATADL